MDNNILKKLNEQLIDSVDNKKIERKNFDNMEYFVNNNRAYMTAYDTVTKRLELRRFQIEDDNINSTYDVVSEWIADIDKLKPSDINMMCNDFIGIMDSKINIPSNIANNKNEKSNIIFFVNRIANIFPELKSDIIIEKECYSQFRIINFLDTKFLPLFHNLLKHDNTDKRISKFCSLISEMYKSEDIKIKSIITMGILNNINDSKYIDTVNHYISNELKLAWAHSKKWGMNRH